MSESITEIVRIIGAEAGAQLVAETARLAALGARLGVDAPASSIVSCAVIRDAVLADRPWTDEEGLEQLRADPAVAQLLREKTDEGREEAWARHEKAMSKMTAAERISYARREGIATPQPGEKMDSKKAARLANFIKDPARRIRFAREHGLK